MKKWLIGAGILAALLIGGYFVLTFYALKFIQPRLQTSMRPGFTLNEIELKATYLSARGIHYEDPGSKQRFFQAEEIRVYPSLLSFLKKSLRIKKLTFLQPSFFFYRSREGRMVGPWMTLEKESEGKEVPAGEVKKGGESVEVQIDRIQVRNGSVDFEDGKTGDPSSQIRLRALNFEIEDIEYPLASSHSPVELNGKIEGRTQEGSIRIHGWVDVKTIDMETSLEIRGVDVTTFEPYYRKRVSAEIESGTLDLETRIAVKEKRVDAPGELNLINLRIKEGEGTVLWIPAKTLVSLLEKKGNQLKAKFRVKGNVDNPRFSLQETFLTQIAISLAQALGIPIQVIGEEVLQGTLGGEKGLAEELKSMERLFKKKKEKKR